MPDASSSSSSSELDRTAEAVISPTQPEPNQAVEHVLGQYRGQQRPCCQRCTTLPLTHPQSPRPARSRARPPAADAYALAPCGYGVGKLCWQCFAGQPWPTVASAQPCPPYLLDWQPTRCVLICDSFHLPYIVQGEREYGISSYRHFPACMTAKVRGPR